MLLLAAILAFLVIFTALILVHEWGHFKAARTFGVCVEEFGLGLPPFAKRLFTDKKGTDYTLNWLPLGGFVRMKGEDTHDAKILKAKDSFAAQPVWQRIIIVCAGVAMNYLIGFILLSFVFAIGTTYLVPLGQTADVLAKRPTATLVSEERLGILINDIREESPAAAAGVKKYDLVVAVDGREFNTPEELQTYVGARADQTVMLDLRRRDYAFSTTATVGTDGKLGIAISDAVSAVKLQYAPLNAVIEGGRETWRMTTLIFDALGGMIHSIVQGHMPTDVGGPVAIAKETYYRATDIVSLLNFAAMLSITLAVFNILPIPALDGGRFVFLVYELVTRHRPSAKIEAKIHAAGFIFLIGLILLITFKDIFLG